VVLSCEIADSIMNFVIGLSQKQISENYPQITKSLPKVLDILTHSVGPWDSLSQNLRDLLKFKISPKTSQGKYEN
jgi:hypothetical protein